MIKIMFDNGYQLSLPGAKVKLVEKGEYIEIKGEAVGYIHVNYKKILFIEEVEDRADEVEEIEIRPNENDVCKRYEKREEGEE